MSDRQSIIIFTAFVAIMLMIVTFYCTDYLEKRLISGQIQVQCK